MLSASGKDIVYILLAEMFVFGFIISPPFQYRRLLVSKVLPRLRRAGHADFREMDGTGEFYRILKPPSIAREVAVQVFSGHAKILYKIIYAALGRHVSHVYIRDHPALADDGACAIFAGLIEPERDVFPAGDARRVFPQFPRFFPGQNFTGERLPDG